MPAAAANAPARPSVATTTRPVPRRQRGGELARRRRQAERACDLARFGFVDDQHVDRVEPRRGQRRGRRRVQHDPRATGASTPGECERFGVRRLELQHERRGRTEHRVRHVRGAGERIGARYHGDRVLAGIVDVDQRDAGRRVGRANAREVDARRIQQREGRRGERVAADGAEHRDVGAGAACGERLVRPLAARTGREARAGERFARTRQPRDARDEVEVDRAEDDDHALRPVSRRRRRARRRP